MPTTRIDRLKKKQSPISRPTLQDLLAVTPGEILDRARSQCRPLRAQYAIGSKEGWSRSRAKFPTYYNEQRMYTVCTDGKRYSYIRFYGKPDVKTPVWVWCSCPYFKYYLEVALSYRNGTSIKTDGGPTGRRPVRNAPPNVRNPHQDLYLCKHLVVAAEVGVKQTQDHASKKYEAEYGSDNKEASTRVSANTTPSIPWVPDSWIL